MQTTERKSYRPHPQSMSDERRRLWDAFEAEERQYELAKTGQAENQCQHCGAFRPDGYPPMFHVRGVPHPG